MLVKDTSGDDYKHNYTSFHSPSLWKYGLLAIFRITPLTNCIRFMSYYDYKRVECTHIIMHAYVKNQMTYEIRVGFWWTYQFSRSDLRLSKVVSRVNILATHVHYEQITVKSWIVTVALRAAFPKQQRNAVETISLSKMYTLYRSTIKHLKWIIT